MKETNAKILGRVVVAFFMTQVVTFTITTVSIGWNTTFIDTWLRNHLLALAVGVPTCLILTPLVEKLINILLEKKSGLIDHK